MGSGSAKVCAAAALVSLALFGSSAAHAQAPPPAPPARADAPTALVPPKLISKPDVPYPDGARGDGVVVLELVVDVTGAVSDARVVKGDAPFASAALEHARDLQFEPANRNGTAVAARIHVELRFRQPVAAPPVAPPPSTNPIGGSSPPAPKPPPPDIEVVVTGKAIEAEKVVLTGAEVRQLPGAFGDAFRAIEALPGVTPIFSGVPFFYVRGAPPGNAGYFLDGIRVPLLYHFALGPSVINPALVDRVELFPGAYPARYGRFAGGIVAAETKPPEYEFHGEGNVRVFDAGALVEAPFDERRGAVLVGGRYSYTAAVLSLLAPGVKLAYWDYQGRAAYQLDAHDTLSAFAFGSYDYFGQDDNQGVTQPIAATQFHRVDLRWDRVVSPDTRFRFATTLGRDETLVADEELQLRDHLVRLRTEGEHHVDPETTLSFGADVALDDYVVHYRPSSASGFDVPPSPDPSQPQPPPVPSRPTRDEQRIQELLPPRQDLTSGVWAEVAWRADPRILVTPGLRLDYYVIQHASALSIEPRVSALFSITPHLRLKHALGLAQQPPSFVVPVPGFALSGLEEGLQRSIQASSGVEMDLPARFTGSLTLFDNVFLNMTDFLSRNELDSNVGDLTDRNLGSGIGVEVLVRRPLTERLGGFVAYTLSRSTRSVANRHYLSRFDRTHVVNFALGYDLGRRWRAGGRLMYYSGFPSAREYRGTLDANGYHYETIYQRTTPFYRLDLRLEKQWRLGERGHWSLVFEFLNATLNKESVGVDCFTDVSTLGGEVVLTCHEQKVGPVSIPSIGVEAAF